MEWKASGADDLLVELGYRGPGDARPPTLSCAVEDAHANGDEGRVRLVCALPNGGTAEVPLNVTPAPSAAISAIENGVTLVAEYTPGLSCGLTCRGWGGWVAVRRADDDTLVLGLSKSHREPAHPSDLFAPLEFELDSGNCPIEPQGSCGEGWDGPWRRGQYLVVHDGDEVASIPAGDRQTVSATVVRVGLAEDGDTGSCCFDCGDAGMLSFMLEAASGG
jgi:hypothetical protein